MLVAVRGLLSYAVSVSEAPRSVLGQIYELADSRDLPAEAQGEDGGLFYRLRPVHSLREPETQVDRAQDAEPVAIFVACRNARDRLIVLLVGRVGLRRGQVAGLRRSDVHLLPDSRALGCDYAGAHVHVRRRENVNGAWSKSRQAWVAPLDFLVVSAFDLYYEERYRLLGAGGSDFLLVNLFRAPLGEPMSPEAIGELLERLSARAGLARRVGAHMARRAFASNVADAGGAPDEVQAVLGHKAWIRRRRTCSRIRSVCGQRSSGCRHRAGRADRRPAGDGRERRSPARERGADKRRTAGGNPHRLGQRLPRPVGVGLGAAGDHMAAAASGDRPARLHRTWLPAGNHGADTADVRRLLGAVAPLQTPAGRVPARAEGDQPRDRPRPLHGGQL
ncbi:site-specific integrase [Streptomyces coeruleorubidus]|uniref:site-specific integrase n=1 Tax=Streptomyces coeruleorubidus TaxID=116188 RepID=UPI0033D9982C